MEAYWIDSHSHMNDDPFREGFDEYIKRALQANVRRINLICLNRAQLEYALERKKQYSFLDVTFGYHPEDADKISEEDIAYLEEVISDPRIIALGEIGLDYYWVSDNKERQKELFIRQIEIANRANKPIVIHSRSAAQDSYDILKKHARTKVLLHCFGESNEMMKEYLKLGYYVSFTGVLTFKNSKNVQHNAATADIGRIMIETDCPYMTPVPLRGQQNESSYVHYVGEFLAELREMSAEDLQLQLISNYERFFDEKD
ncbi:MAG: TatD family hydrolase [Erysipelotrichaceae bacterium]|nr:TatD family hydrolase [Erysipelotrichaceae bacterium]